MKTLIDLTTEEKRVLCAGACGNSGLPFIENGESYPPYDTSLDAMAAAIDTLEWNETDAYLDALARIVDPAHGYRMELTFGVANATARHRLDAFLIAKGICK